MDTLKAKKIWGSKKKNVGNENVFSLRGANRKRAYLNRPRRGRGPVWGWGGGGNVEVVSEDGNAGKVRGKKAGEFSIGRKKGLTQANGTGVRRKTAFMRGKKHWGCWFETKLPDLFGKKGKEVLPP